MSDKNSDSALKFKINNVTELFNIFGGNQAPGCRVQTDALSIDIAVIVDPTHPMMYEIIEVYSGRQITSLTAMTPEEACEQGIKVVLPLDCKMLEKVVTLPQLNSSPKVEKVIADRQKAKDKITAAEREEDLRHGVGQRLFNNEQENVFREYAQLIETLLTRHTIFGNLKERAVRELSGVKSRIGQIQMGRWQREAMSKDIKPLLRSADEIIKELENPNYLKKVFSVNEAVERFFDFRTDDERVIRAIPQENIERYIDLLNTAIDRFIDGQISSEQFEKIYDIHFFIYRHGAIKMKVDHKWKNGSLEKLQLRTRELAIEFRMADALLASRSYETV